MKILLPKIVSEVDLEYGPLFFLAGPVRGGDDWQHQCCIQIQSQIPEFYAALPCRYQEDHPLFPFKMNGNQCFGDQLSWERYYLDMAGRKGCILFWLPCESKINPRGGHEPYAMDTRGELGEWRGQLMHNPDLRVVIGADPQFPSLSQIRRNFSQALGYDFPIYNTLVETVTTAIRKCTA